MPGTKLITRTGRNGVATCVALFLSFASLAPVALNTSDGSIKACCRGRGKCTCCDKANTKTPAGPVASVRSCGGACGQLAWRGGDLGRFAPPSTRWFKRIDEISLRVSGYEPDARYRLKGDATRQRPPPDSRAA